MRSPTASQQGNRHPAPQLKKAGSTNNVSELGSRLSQAHRVSQAWLASPCLRLHGEPRSWASDLQNQELRIFIFIFRLGMKLRAWQVLRP